MKLASRLVVAGGVIVWLFIFSLLSIPFLSLLSLLLRPESTMAWIAGLVGTVFLVQRFIWDFLPKFKGDWKYVFET